MASLTFILFTFLLLSSFAEVPVDKFDAFTRNEGKPQKDTKIKAIKSSKAPKAKSKALKGPKAPKAPKGPEGSKQLSKTKTPKSPKTGKSEKTETTIKSKKGKSTYAPTFSPIVPTTSKPTPKLTSAPTQGPSSLEDEFSQTIFLSASTGKLDDVQKKAFCDEKVSEAKKSPGSDSVTITCGVTNDLTVVTRSGQRERGNRGLQSIVLVIRFSLIWLSSITGIDLAALSISFNEKAGQTVELVSTCQILQTSNIPCSQAFAVVDATKSPTNAPNNISTNPSSKPSLTTSAIPSASPTTVPSPGPTVSPTNAPTSEPTKAPTTAPTPGPTVSPTNAPTSEPTKAPTTAPSPGPTVSPTNAPTSEPTKAPTTAPTPGPTVSPTNVPTSEPTNAPTTAPSPGPTGWADPFSFSYYYSRNLVQTRLFYVMGKQKE